MIVLFFLYYMTLIGQHGSIIPFLNQTHHFSGSQNKLVCLLSLSTDSHLRCLEFSLSLSLQFPDLLHFHAVCYCIWFQISFILQLHQFLIMDRKYLFSIIFINFYKPSLLCCCHNGSLQNKLWPLLPHFAFLKIFS